MTTRLHRQRLLVHAIMTERHAWWSIAGLRRVLREQYGCRAMETSVSARIRDLRKLGLRVVRKYGGKPGLWLYRVVVGGNS